MDQLTISRIGSNIEPIYSKKYPGYIEHKIEFKPTYKRESNENKYKNKKNQAPSYCDRILFKNNTCNGIQVFKYNSIEDIFGSDHRPVLLQLSLKTFQNEDLIIKKEDF